MSPITATQQERIKRAWFKQPLAMQWTSTLSMSSYLTVSHWVRWLRQKSVSETNVCTHSTVREWQMPTASIWCNVTSKFISTLSYEICPWKPNLTQPEHKRSSVIALDIAGRGSVTCEASQREKSHSSNICIWQAAESWRHPKQTFHAVNWGNRVILDELLLALRNQSISIDFCLTVNLMRNDQKKCSTSTKK